MSNPEAFAQAIQTGYTFNGPAITLGVAMLDGAPVSGSLIKLPLSTLNRHGLVAHWGMNEIQGGLVITRPVMLLQY